MDQKEEDHSASAASEEDDESEEEIDDNSTYSSSNPPTSPSNNSDTDSDSDSDDLIAPRSQQSPASPSKPQSPVESEVKTEEATSRLILENSNHKSADQTDMSPRKSPIYKAFALQAHLPISKRYEDRHHLLSSSKYYKPGSPPLSSNNSKPPSPKTAKYLSVPPYRHEAFDRRYSYGNGLVCGKSYSERHYLHDKNIEEEKRMRKDYELEVNKYRESVTRSGVPSMTQIMPPILYSTRDIKTEPLPPIHTIPSLQRNYSPTSDAPTSPYYPGMPRYPRSPTELDCKHSAFGESMCREDCACQNALKRFVKERRLKDMLNGMENGGHLRTSTYERTRDLYKRYSDDTLENKGPCRKDCCVPRGLDPTRIQGKRHHSGSKSPLSPDSRSFLSREEFAKNAFTYDLNGYRYGSIIDEKPEKLGADWPRAYSDTDPERVKVIVGEPNPFYPQSSHGSIDDRTNDSKNRLSSVTNPTTGLHYLTVPQVHHKDVGYMSKFSVITIETTGKKKTPSPKKFEPNLFKGDEFRSPKKSRHDSMSPKPSIQVSTVDSSTSSSKDSVAECSGLMGLTKVANEHLGQAIAKERKRGKTKGINNNCLHLWEFLRDMLNHEAQAHLKCIEWTNKDQGEFRLIKTALIAQLWGKSKNRKQMTYEKMARAMRYYYKMGILEKVPHKRLHFRFGAKMLAKVFSEPMKSKLNRVKLQIEEHLGNEKLRVGLPPLITAKKVPSFENKFGIPESPTYSAKAYSIPVSPMNSVASASTPETPLEYSSGIEDVSEGESCGDTKEDVIVDGLDEDSLNKQNLEGLSTELTKLPSEDLSMASLTIRTGLTPLPDLIPLNSERMYHFIGHEGKVVA